MDSQTTQTIKLPILQPGEYDLWKMRMEQYLQCIDYTLWEIIENGNAPIVTKTVDGKETVIPPTSVEEKAQRRAKTQLALSVYANLRTCSSSMSIPVVTAWYVMSQMPCWMMLEFEKVLVTPILLGAVYSKCIG
ncbi:hypothetical protein Tco_0788122 [Tanacetum coccineum]